jgi:hypothetical protein
MPGIFLPNVPPLGFISDAFGTKENKTIQGHSGMMK